MTQDSESQDQPIDEPDYLTTISIWANSTKRELDSFKLIEDESYDHIINRLIRKARKSRK